MSNRKPTTTQTYKNQWTDNTTTCCFQCIWVRRSPQFSSYICYRTEPFRISPQHWSLWPGCLSSHQANSVYALKKTHSTEHNREKSPTVVILSSSTPEWGVLIGVGTYLLGAARAACMLILPFEPSHLLQIFDRFTVKHALQNTQNDCHQWLSDSSKLHQIRFQTPLGELTALPRPPSWLKGPYF